MILCFWFPIQPPTRQHLSHHPNQSIHSFPILKELITHQQSIQFHSPHRNTSIVYSPQNITLEFYSHHPNNSSFNPFTSNETTLSHPTTPFHILPNRHCMCMPLFGANYPPLPLYQHLYSLFCSNKVRAIQPNLLQ